MNRDDVLQTTLTLIQNRDKDRAILVSTDGDAETAFWLDRRDIAFEPSGEGTILVFLPRWLAEERGLKL